MAGVEAELVVVNATVHTMDSKRSLARAFAVVDGRFAAVGTNQQAERVAGKETKTLDLGGKVALPGFIDAHTHAMDAAGREGWVGLRTTRSLADALDRLRFAAKAAAPGAWIVAEDWDESRWPERRYLTRADLDAVSTDHPILACRVDMHMGSANTAAMRAAGLREDAPGFSSGVVNEETFETLRERVRPGPSELAAKFPAVQQRLHSLGITGIHDMVSPPSIEAYLRVRAAGRLALRVLANPYIEAMDTLIGAGLRTGFGDEHVRLGPLKAFSDGSLGARTAALSTAYADDPATSGRLMYEPDELRGLLRRAHDTGFQLAVHAIGDRAIDAVADILGSLEGARARRHRIEHFELPSPAALDAMARAGLVASMQPDFVGDLSQPGGMYESRLGPSRIEANNPYRSILARRIPLAFGSDGMPYDPLFGIASAVNAPFEDQRIGVGDAIAAYTRGAAYAGGQDRYLGSIEPGKLADFVVLERDPFREPKEIASIPVALTAVGGHIVHRR